MALAIDGNANAIQTGSSGTTTCTSSAGLSTNSTSGVLVCLAAADSIAGATSSPNVASVAGGGLTWHQYTTYNNHNSSFWACHEIWWAPYTGSAISNATITVTFTNNSGSFDAGTMICFAVTGFLGTAYQTNPWDADSPFTAGGTTSVVPSVTGVNTASANSMMIGSAWNISGSSDLGAGSGYTEIASVRGADAFDQHLTAEYQVFSSTQSSITVAMGNTSTASGWTMIAAALAQGSAAAALNFGWYSRVQDDRPPPIALNPDEAKPFFRPSQVPVPTRWWGTLDDSHPPSIKRPPDEPTTWFLKSPNPVPITWLPTTGAEDRPPPIKRPPDEPTTWFLKSPVSITWLPTTGAEDRPPAQKRPPDEPFPWFVRSPNPVPITWLPTTGAEDRPAPAPPDASLFTYAPKVPKPPVGISGIAWWRQTEVYVGPPPPQLDYRQAWAPHFIIQVAGVTVRAKPFFASMGSMMTIPGDEPIQ